jgi:hypothetical protein
MTMTTTASPWRLTPHARQRLADRAVTAHQLWSVLERPDRIYCMNAFPGVETRAGFGIFAAVNVDNRIVVTVGIDGANADDWEDVVLRNAGIGDSRDLVPLPKLPDEQPSFTPRIVRNQPAASPVSTRNVLDGLAPGVRRAALQAAGGDVRRIRVLGPGRVEIV